MAAQVQTGAGNVTSSFANTGTAAPAVAKPSNTADNDVLVACAYGRSNTAQYTGIPAGWVTVDPDGTRETATGWQTLFYKPITSAASEPSSYQWTGGANGRHLVMVVRVTGADLASLLDDAGDDALAVGGTPQTLPMPAVTPAGSDSLLITCESTQTGTGAAASILNPPAGVTKIATVSTTSGSQNNHLGMSYQQLSSAGSTGVLTFTASSTLQSGVGYGLTIKSGVTATNVNLTGAVTGSGTSTPAGSLTTVSNVAATGQAVSSVTGVAAGVLTVTTNIGDAGATAGSTTAAPAGTLTLVGNAAFTGQTVGSTTGALAGALTRVSNVTLTGQTAGVTTSAPAGTVSAGTGSTSVALTGAVAGSVSGAPTGTLTVVSVGNVTLTGQPVGSTTTSPAGTAALTSVGNVNLTGLPVGSGTTAPAGTLTSGSNVALTGTTVGTTAAALAGMLEVVSNVILDGLAVGTVALTPAGALTITQAGDGHPVPVPSLTLTLPAPSLTVTSADPELTITTPDPRLELD